MRMRNRVCQIAAVAVFFTATAYCYAQNTSPTPLPQPPSTKESQQESIKVFTEEVMLPVQVVDDRGRFDPTLEVNDLLVLEDNVLQQVRSVRRDPSSVLLLLDTAGGGNPAMRTNSTRDLALGLVSRLRPGDRMAALQFGGRVELIQSWTTETSDITGALKTKLSSGRRPRVADALVAAASLLNQVPAGSRHVVLITDGGELASEKTTLAQAVENILSAGATVHVISYTAWGRQAINKRHPKFWVTITADKRKSAQDVADELVRPNDPETLDTKLKRKIYLVIENDFQVWRKNRKYVKALNEGEQWLRWMAEETGGSIWLPTSTEELDKQAAEVAQEISSHYVVTYTPKRLLSPGTVGEVRSIKVAASRLGLRVSSRRSYIAVGPQR